MGDLRVGNTTVLAAALGIKESVVSPRAGSSTLSCSMSSGALRGLRDTLMDKVSEKLSSLQKSIGALVEGPERGVSILNVFRQAGIPVITLLDELRSMPDSNKDPISFLKERGFSESSLEKLGLREGMSKCKCQEILGQHFQEILKEVGVDSGVRNLCKLAMYGEDYYRKLSSKLKAASAIADKVADIVAKPILWIARGVTNALGKDSGQWSDAQTVKAVASAAGLLAAICIPLSSSLAVATGVMFGVFLLLKGVSALLKSIDEAFVKTCLEGKKSTWEQFFSDLFRKISETVDDVAPAAMAVAGIVAPEEAKPEDPAETPNKDNSGNPSISTDKIPPDTSIPPIVAAAVK
jgi:hypothetical protein